MLSWLERGLPPDFVSDDSDAAESVTEFLVAPFAQKGANSGKAKKWVDRQRHEREVHEACRFALCRRHARPRGAALFRAALLKSVNGAPSELVEPRESLLRTAWPAWKDEIQRRFDECRASSPAQPTTIASIAASGSGNLFEFKPIADEPTLVRRLPTDFSALTAPLAPAADETLIGVGGLYERHEGGLLSRALGKAVHALLQQLAQRLITETREAALATLAKQQPGIAASIRAAGIERGAAIRMAAEAVDIVRRAAGDPLAQWILEPHADAANEVRWTGVVAGRLRTVQVDRAFRAGHAPQIAAASPNEEAWWIIDYKTAHEEGLDRAALLPELRRQFKPQIEAYAAVLRNLRGADVRLCGGLYYPRMALFDWWEM